MFEITKGVLPKPVKLCIYSVEGLGKSTFASKFPDPLFIDTEGSTKYLDVRRLETPTSWTMLMQEVDYVANNPTICKTLVIDTMDWAERLCMDDLLKRSNPPKKSIEEYSYGKGYTMLMEEIGRLLDKLSVVCDRGINIVLTAHAAMRTVTLPEETGTYDRWEMKMQKKTCPLVKEWVDVLIFANYKTLVYKDEKSGKNKASGGERVMYTQHRTCWDAKNRFGMPDELPFDYAYVKPILAVTAPDPEPEKAPEPTPEPVPAPKPEPAPTGGAIDRLRPLMKQAGVTEEDVESAVAAQGFYPKDMKMADYDPAFIDGMLIANWDAVVETIKELKDVPF